MVVLWSSLRTQQVCCANSDDSSGYPCGQHVLSPAKTESTKLKSVESISLHPKIHIKGHWRIHFSLDFSAAFFFLPQPPKSCPKPPARLSRSRVAPSAWRCPRSAPGSWRYPNTAGSPPPSWARRRRPWVSQQFNSPTQQPNATNDPFAWCGWGRLGCNDPPCKKLFTCWGG